MTEFAELCEELDKFGYQTELPVIDGELKLVIRNPKIRDKKTNTPKAMCMVDFKPGRSNLAAREARQKLLGDLTK